MWMKERPTESGWYFFRQSWWNKDWVECCFVFWDDEDDPERELVISRVTNTHPDMLLARDVFDTAMWQKIEMPDV